MVTNVDVTATALEALGIDRPVAVLGDPMEPVAGPAALEARVAQLGRMSAAAVAIDVAQARVSSTRFIVLVVVAARLLPRSLLGLPRSWHGRAVPRFARGLQALLLLTLSVPLASWLMFLVTPLPATPGIAVASLARDHRGGLARVTARRGGACRSACRWRRLGLLAARAVIVVDQLFGAPLSATGFFSYSPLLGCALLRDG